MFEACAKVGEFKSIVFALCYFHAAILERKKFGVGNLPDAASGIGWNMNYPFNTGDLLCCGQGLSLVHFSAQPEPFLVTEAMSSAHFSALPETFIFYRSYHHIQQQVLTSIWKADWCSPQIVLKLIWKVNEC
jgi:hypothetical protein